MSTGTFMALYRKELTAVRWRMAACFGLIILWQLLVSAGIGGVLGLYNPNIGDLARTMAFPWSLLPFVALPFWAVGVGFNSLRAEWEDRHSEFLFCLPVPAWQIMLSKLLAAMSEVTLYSLVIPLGSAAFFPSHFKELLRLPPGVPSSLLAEQIAKVYVLLWLAVAALTILAQFAFVYGRLIPRFSIPISFGAFLVGLWGFLRFGLLAQILARLLGWQPQLDFKVVDRVNNASQYVPLHLNIAPFLGLLLLALFLFVTSNWLLKRQIDA